MFDPSRNFLRFSLRATTALWIVVAISSCGKEEAEMEAPEIAQGAAQSMQEMGQAVEAADKVSSSQDNRTPTTPVPQSAKPTWSQATTPEERRANLEEALAVESGPYVIDMHDLGGWELDEREEKPIPDYILALDGKEFIMRGFMMPDIDFEHIRSFHLVRSLFSCCFGAPPQINEIMRVTLADEDGMDYTYNTIEVRGRLQVTFEMVDGLVEDLFRLENVTYRILEFDDPDAPKSFDANTGFDSIIPTGSQEY